MIDESGATLYTSAAELRAALGIPSELAARKVRTQLDKYARAFIERSPFVVLGTASVSGAGDVSPRGDVPGFVLVVDDRTLFLPERPGNARYDSLLNIVENPAVALLFFVPGFDDMLRVNGRGTVLHHPGLLARCAVNGKVPHVGIRVQVEEAFLHCAKALRRGKLWDSATCQDRKALPTLGRMILEQLADAGEMSLAEGQIAAVDTAIEENYRQSLY